MIRTEMTKADVTTSSSGDSLKGDKKKKSIMPKLFGSKKYIREGSEDDSMHSNVHVHENIASIRAASKDTPARCIKSVLDGHSNSGIEGLNLSNFEQTMSSETLVQDVRIYVGTWNVGGKAPHHGLNLEDFLQVEALADIYVLGFQEIVPLSAGNVLVIEDNEPAAKWLALINQALNKPITHHDLSSVSVYPESGSSSSKHLKDPKSKFFKKQSLKVLSKSLKADTTLLKSCNCHNLEPSKRKPRKLINETVSSFSGPLVGECLEISKNSRTRSAYRLIASKQMVGLYLTIWARKEIVQDIGHLRICCVGRGIMGYLGNKGCISVSLSLHQTSFCFVCSHLASGEKEGDEIKRNSDVSEIIKSTQFNKICKSSSSRIPDRIIDHDRIIWLGDLNYRVSLSYEETKSYIEQYDWDPLLEKDQLIVEREAGRVFCGFKEGKILFPPTYKYSHNSDSYAAGEFVKSKKKRRTPAWCDRILWRGNGIEQLSYIRGESRLSDHRPVCAVFAVEVEKKSNNTARFRKGYSYATKFGYEDCIPERHSFYD